MELVVGQELFGRGFKGGWNGEYDQDVLYAHIKSSKIKIISEH